MNVLSVGAPRRTRLNLLIRAALLSSFAVPMAHAGSIACTVNTTDDDPGTASATTTGTLRDCLLYNNLLTGPSGQPNFSAQPIQFDASLAGSTIHLQDDLPMIFNNTTIDGGTGAPITIDGGGQHRIFFVSGMPDSTTGSTPDPDGAQALSVLLHNLQLNNGYAHGGDAGAVGGGGMGAGGALFVNKNATVTLDHVGFDGNIAQGGDSLTGPAYDALTGAGGMGGSASLNGNASGGLSGSGYGTTGGGIGTDGDGTYGGTFGGTGLGQISDSQNFNPYFATTSNGGHGIGEGGSDTYGPGFGGGGGLTTHHSQSGGFGGGGGAGESKYGSNRPGGYGGNGGFGGGSGGGGLGSDSTGADGNGWAGGFSGTAGFGGGAGAGGGGGACRSNGSTGYLGGDGGNSGVPGIGGGYASSGQPGTPCAAGSGYGSAGSSGHGGGGAGFGGAVFVRNGGSLTILDSGQSAIQGGSVQPGTGQNDGAAAGAGLFVMSGSTLLFNISGRYTVNDSLADDSGMSVATGQGFKPGSGAGAALSKSGAGALFINADDTLFGSLSVSAGTLGGNGSIIGQVTLSPGASIAPGDPASGNGIGTFSLIGLDWQADGIMDFQLGGDTGTHDTLLIGDSLTKSGAGSFAFHFGMGGHPPVPGTYTLIDSPSFGGFTASDFSFTFDATYNDLQGSFAINGTQLQFTVTGVDSDRIFADGVD